MLLRQYSSSADCASGSGDDVSFFYYTPFDECLQYIGNIKASSCDGKCFYIIYEMLPTTLIWCVYFIAIHTFVFIFRYDFAV
jgi:hypothetical protein